MPRDTNPTDAGKGQSDFDPLHDAIQTFTHIDPPDRWVEVLAAIVLALATIASSWSAYQATRWGGVQANAYAEAGAARAESVRASDLADADLTLDVEYFAIWLDEAGQGGDEEARALLERAFRPEFTAAFEPWLALDPLSNPEIWNIQIIKNISQQREFFPCASLSTAMAVAWAMDLRILHWKKLKTTARDVRI